MIYHVVHATEYTYSRAVFLEPHVIRLRPRSDGTQHLRSFHIAIEPQPAGVSAALDAEGNAVLHAWFNEQTERLTITTEFEIETLRANPFDFILADAAMEQLPLHYAALDTARLAHYRADAGSAPSVAALAANVAEQCGGNTLRFLELLTQEMYQKFTSIVRETGDPALPEETLTKKTGSCRDFAVLFVSACRSQGIAARFVSGYQEGDLSQPLRYLHAWAEVYLPGGGWRGYDPSHGLAVGAGHIAVAASHDPLGASPVQGSFRGSNIDTALAARIELYRG